MKAAAPPLHAMGFATAILAGAAVGARHSLESDHVAAVATLVERERRPALVGASWGLGHSATVVAAGMLFLLAGFEPPTAVAHLSEALAGLLMIGLGARTILAVAGSVERKRHSHGGRVEGHTHGHLAVGSVAIGGRHSHLQEESFGVGVVHGLAGSGGLVALLVAGSSSTAAGAGYLAAFAVATVAVMALTSELWGRVVRTGERLRTVAGVASVAAGALLVLSVV